VGKYRTFIIQSKYKSGNFESGNSIYLLLRTNNIEEKLDDNDK